MWRFHRIASRWCLPITAPGIKDVELAMKAGYSTAPDQVRSLGFGAGMGLPNIKKYTDEMVIETEIDVGTTMRLKVYTQNQPSA